MRVNLMIEGQEHVTWEQWVAIATACEDAGLEGLFRSDHYQSVAARTERSSLDAWATLAALGLVTERIRLGTPTSTTRCSPRRTRSANAMPGSCRRVPRPAASRWCSRS